MQLGLTFPLQRRLKLRAVPYGTPSDRACCWDLHCITLRGQDSLLQDLSSLAVEQLRLGLLDAGLSEQTVTDYLQKAGAPELTRTHGRREVAFLNRAWDDVLALDYTVDTASVRQPLLEQAVNGLPCRCAGFEGRESAKQFLYRSFQII